MRLSEAGVNFGRVEFHCVTDEECCCCCCCFAPFYALSGCSSSQRVTSNTWGEFVKM